MTISHYEVPMEMVKMKILWKLNSQVQTKGINVKINYFVCYLPTAHMGQNFFSQISYSA